MTRPLTLKGYRIKNGKVEKVHGYGMNASQKIRQRTSKKVRPTRRMEG